MKTPTDCTHIIVRDFRSERLFLKSLKPSGFVWSANRRYAQKFTLGQARVIIEAHAPYAVAEREVAAMHTKTRELATFAPRVDRSAQLAAAKLDAYSDATRAARLIARANADYRRAYLVNSAHPLLGRVS